MPVPPFTQAQVKDILDLSEDSTTPGGAHRGHSRSRHVDISERHLHARLLGGKATREGVPMYTRFLSTDDQDSTVATALNDATVQARIEEFYAKRLAALELKDIVLANSVKVRMAVTGGARSTLLDASFVTVRLHWHPLRPRSLHISSAFAAVGFA